MISSAISKAAMAALISLCFGAGGSFAKDGAAAKVVVANFDFVDTSGEVKDETARHETQLHDFESVLRETMAKDRGIDPVALSCEAGRCSLADPGVDQLLRQAKAANARYLVTGGLHKMSTLVGWAKFVVFDLEKSGQVCDRLLTYRGDTAEAWRRAAKFSAEDIVRYCFADVRQPG
ncbi:DUF2380 domain-containing protein [Mesorhizobium sp. A556]